MRYIETAPADKTGAVIANEIEVRLPNQYTLSHRIALDPTYKQRQFFARCAGVSRFAYNWFLAEDKRQYEAHKANPNLPKPKWGELDAQLNRIKANEFPWMYEVPSCIPQQAQRNLAKAFGNLKAGRARYPHFKKKGKSRDSFRLTNNGLKVSHKRIRIQKLGWVRMRLPLRFTGKIMSATITRTADRWYVSLAVELDGLGHLPAHENQGAVGVDLGVKDLAVLSTGERVAGPKSLKRELRALARANRRLSRRQRGSANRRKAASRLVRIHARVANVRRESLHELTDNLTRRFNVVGIEDLNVSGMVRNRSLARSIADMGFGEFRRQLEYKAQMRAVQVVVADRFYPSSKTCSACGLINSLLTLSDRSWVCGCGARHDRDLNAAINLRNLAATSAASACGGTVSPGLAQQVPVKQEPDSTKGIAA